MKGWLINLFPFMIKMKLIDKLKDIDNIKLEINPLDMSLSFILLGLISNNYDFTSAGLSIYQANYIEKLYPK